MVVGQVVVALAMVYGVSARRAVLLATTPMSKAEILATTVVSGTADFIKARSVLCP